MSNEISPVSQLDRVASNPSELLDDCHSKASAPKARNSLVNAVLCYIGNRTSTRTEKQIEEDRTIFGYDFKRWLILPAAFLIQFSAGSIFAWSVFNQPIDGYIYGNIHQGKAPITFSIMYCFGGIGSVIKSPLLERRGPRFVLAFSTLFFAVGHLITALGVYFQNIWIVYLGYGVICGYGGGSAYIVPISVLQKWYPDHRGFASGFAVLGLGIGSIVFAKITIPFIQLLGVPLTFVAYAALHLVLLSIGTFIMRTPPPDYTLANSGNAGNTTTTKDTSKATPTKIKYTLIETLLNREYRLLYWVFVSSTMFYLCVAPRLSNVVIDIFKREQEMATTIVSVDGAFSAFGRLSFAWLSDAFGRKTMYSTVIALELVCMSMMIVFIQSDSFWPYALFNWLSTSCFGGSLSLVPPIIAELFGVENVSIGFGIMFLGWGISAAISGILFAAIYDYLVGLERYTASDPAVYVINYYWLLVICCTGMICLWFMRMTVQDRLLPMVPGQLLLVRIGKRLLRISTSRGIEVMSYEMLNSEWNTFWHAQDVPSTGCIPASTAKQIINTTRRKSISNA